MKQKAVRVERGGDGPAVRPRRDGTRHEAGPLIQHHLESVGQIVLAFDRSAAGDELVDGRDEPGAVPHEVDPDHRQVGDGLVRLLDEAGDCAIAPQLDDAEAARIVDRLDVHYAVRIDLRQLGVVGVGDGVDEDDERLTVDVLPRQGERVRLAAQLGLEHVLGLVLWIVLGDVSLDLAAQVPDDEDQLVDLQHL